MPDIDLKFKTLALAKKYTKDTADGMGAVQGAPCTIRGITDNADGTHTVTFGWTDNNGNSHESHMIVNDAIQISGIALTADNRFLITMGDGTTYTTGIIPTAKGDDGVSPTVSMTRLANGVKITIVDAAGTHENTVSDGTSPTLTVERNAADDGIIVTATDKNGTTSQNVYDGSSASTLDYVQNITNKPSINGVELSGNRTTTDLNIAIPTKTSDLTNDNNFITATDLPSVDTALSQASENAVQNKVITSEIRAIEDDYSTLLSNVTANATAIETLNGNATVTGSVQKQISDALTNLDRLTKKIVSALPAIADAEQNVIYLILDTEAQETSYIQWTLVDDGAGSYEWARLGSTATDLGDYVTESDMETALQLKQNTITGAASTITSVNLSNDRALISNASGKVAVSPITATELEALDNVTGNVQNQLDAKQDTLTFDGTPTQSSTNPVTSGGVYTALTAKQDTLTFDSTPTASSLNPVTSGGVYTALTAKQDTLTFDEYPKEGHTTQVVSSGALYTTLQSYLVSANAITVAELEEMWGE